MIEEIYDEIDRHDMYEMIKDLKYQIMQSKNLSNNIKLSFNPKTITVVGMGGSGYIGDMLKHYLNYKSYDIEVKVVKDYVLPRQIDKNSTLVFIVSYSGDTQETIECYREALRRGLKVIVITSNGKLTVLSRKNHNPVIKLPIRLVPRLTFPLMFLSILNVLRNNKIVDCDDDIKLLIEKFNPLSYKNTAKALARRLYGKIALIYSTPKLECVGMKWKTDINENAKVMAFHNVFSEFNHNEICGFSKLIANYFVFILSDERESIMMRKRIDIVKDIIKKHGVELQEIVLKGDNHLFKLFAGITIGLWISYFLALSYNTDPTPTPIINELKEKIKERSYSLSK